MQLNARTVPDEQANFLTNHKLGIRAYLFFLYCLLSWITAYILISYFAKINFKQQLLCFDIPWQIISFTEPKVATDRQFYSHSLQNDRLISSLLTPYLPGKLFIFCIFSIIFEGFSARCVQFRRRPIQTKKTVYLAAAALSSSRPSSRPIQTKKTIYLAAAACNDSTIDF